MYLFDDLVEKVAADTEGDSSIVVIAIDDESLNMMEGYAGKWAWPRSTHAELIEGLAAFLPQAIIFDILFSEKDVYRPDADAYFNEVVAENNNIFLPMLLVDGYRKHVDLSVIDKLPIASKPTEDYHHLPSLLLPQALNPDVWRLGTINYQTDFDGVGRSFDSKTVRNDWSFYSLPTIVAKHFGYSTQPPNRFLLRWKGDKNFPYQTFSYGRVYQSVIEGQTEFLSQFEGKHIFIGATAAGLYDERVVPINQNLPGVFVLATAFDNLKNDDYFREVSQVVIIFYLLICLVLLFAFAAITIRYSIVVSNCVFVSVLFTFLNYILVQQLLHHNYFIALGSVTALVWCTSIIICLSMGLLEYRNRKHALNMFGRFLDPKLVISLCEQGKLTAEQLNQGKELTILFADIRNFTQMSEQHSADEIMRLLNEYFAAQVDIIFSTQGTVDKFIGDCIMAFWGAPVDSDMHAVNAIDAALKMEEKLFEFKRTLPKDIAEFDIGIGLHTGKTVVGLIGTKQRVDYTVIGDTVNLASRIEGLTKEVSRILVSESTADKANTHFEFIYHGEFKVKGRKQPVKLYQPKRK